MTPYYQDSAVTIWHADCRDILPQLPPVDLVLTDPPYGVGKEYASHDDTVVALEQLIPLLTPLSPKRLITCGIGNIWKYPPADWVICWSKPNAMTRAAVANANIWEPVLVYGCKGFGVDGVTVSISPQPNGHPCPKPLRLFIWLIERASEMGNLILDPFCGSGTTLRAAKDLGRKAIGIEIEERYCEIAAKRCQQECLPFAVAMPATVAAPQELFDTAEPQP